MAQTDNIARPYSQAIFELARDGGDYQGWGRQLEHLATISELAEISDLINNPLVSCVQIADLVVEISATELDQEGINLARLLVHNRRLIAARAIAEQYAGKRAEAESVVEAELITATSVSAKQQHSFLQSLEQRLGRSVKLDYSVDQDLIGGAVIRAGDWVLDGSVRAQLQKLVSTLGV